MADSERQAPLEVALDEARTLRVRDEVQHRGVTRALNRAAAVHRRSSVSPWRALSVGSWVVTAVCVAALLAVVASKEESPAPTVQGAPAIAQEKTGSFAQIGAQVFAHSYDSASYVVQRADADQTRILVTRGEVGFRLFHLKPHRLTVECEGLIAEAVGTVFVVGTRNGKPFVRVDEGVVRARSGARVLDVKAGRSFAADAAEPVAVESARSPLLLLSEADLVTAPAPVQPVTAAPVVSKPKHTAAEVTRSAPSPTETWAHARDARARGDASGALTALTVLVELEDATWTPIALLERATVLVAADDRQAALRDVDLLRERYPQHKLVLEACALRERLGAPCD